MTDFIHLEDVSFSYHNVLSENPPALSRINLSIQKGEMLALIGSNGSGKSTLARMLNALLLPTAGKVAIAGMDTRDPAHHADIRTRVGLVFQRPQDQFVASTVEEEIAFGPGNLGLPPHEMRARVEHALSHTDLLELRERHPFLLSAGEAQRLALAGVLAMRPDCIIFDESTAMLDPANRAAVMQQAQALHRQGITVIIITHLMEEAAQCGRVAVLNAGRLVMDDEPAEIFSRSSDLADTGLGQPFALQAARTLRKFFPSLPEDILTPVDLIRSLPHYRGKIKKSPQPQSPLNRGEVSPPMIEVQGLLHTYWQGAAAAKPALDGISLRVGEGDMHGLIGASGSGKSTLLQHLNALIRPQQGSVIVDNFNLNDEGLDTKALRRNVSLAFQQPEDQIFEQYVGDEIAFGPRNLGHEGRLADIVRDAMRAVGLDFEAYKDRLTSELSGGERRKVALASVLAIRADILLLDEPLAGLDPHSRAQVLELLGELNRSGKTMLISTHQYEQLSEMLDAVTLIHDGKDLLHGSPSDVFTRFETLHTAGVEAPFHAKLGHAIREKGWPISPVSVSLSTIENDLAQIAQGGA